MTIQLEQIEVLRAKANVGYEEAKQALENCNGDIVEALIYLEKQNKIKAPQNETTGVYTFFAAVKKLIKTCNEIKFVIKKNDVPAVNIPLTIAILVTAFVPPLTIISLIVALLTNHKIRFEKPGVEDMKINKTFDKISDAMSSVGNQVAEVIQKNA